MVVYDLISAHGSALHLSHKLGCCIAGFLGWALLGLMSCVLASEASSFFDAILFILGCELSNLDSVNIYGI